MTYQKTIKGVMGRAAAHAARLAYLICLLAASTYAQAPAATRPATGPDKIPPPLHSAEKIIVADQPALTPGSRPVKVVISGATSDVVARSNVSWGYHDDQGRFKLGGTKEFDYRGGTLSGEIPADFSPQTVEIKAVIDYTNPEVGDIGYRLDAPVTDAGVMVLFDTTSIRCQTTITLLADKKLKLRKDNGLLLTWRYDSNAPGQPPVRHSGVVHFSYSDLKALRGVPLQKQFELPVRSQDDGRLAWSLEGRVGKGTVNVRGSFTPATPRLEINLDHHGVVTHTVAAVP